MKKRLLSCTLAVLMFVSMTVPGFAAAKEENAKVNNAEFVLNDADKEGKEKFTEYLTPYLVELGFTNDEIRVLINEDYNKFKRAENIEVMPMVFPANPQIGDRHTEVYRISNKALGLPYDVMDTISMSQTALAHKLVTILGAHIAPVAFILAGKIIALYNGSKGYSGVEISIEYYYGEDNHCGISWTPGPTYIRGYC